MVLGCLACHVLSYEVGASYGYGFQGLSATIPYIFYTTQQRVEIVLLCGALFLCNFMYKHLLFGGWRVAPPNAVDPFGGSDRFPEAIRLSMVAHVRYQGGG